jgi:glyoxylase-like metal-dependent hydrolase (beta-lactamase superfamily II)
MHAMTYTDVTDNVVSAVASSGKAKKDLETQPPRTTRMTCFALPTELIFVDCGIFVEVASKFRTDMEERFQKPTSHLLLTHTHWDHCFALSAFEDVKIVSSQKGIANLQRGLQTYYRKEARAENAERKYADDEEIREAIKSAKLFLPSHGAKATMIIGTPKGHEILFEVAGGHSADSAFVYSAKERVLCAGDNLLTCYAQIVGNGKKMMKVYERWQAMERLRHVIPGHGDVVNYLTLKR